MILLILALFRWARQVRKPADASHPAYIDDGLCVGNLLTHRFEDEGIGNESGNCDREGGRPPLPNVCFGGEQDSVRGRTSKICR